MKTLEELNIAIDNLSDEPITSVSLLMKTGKQIEFNTILSSMDFIKIWNSHKHSVRILLEKDSYAIINKKAVIFLSFKKI